MPLILAVEPNANQAQQLTALVRQHLKAELVTAASADAALAALGPRVPDLILTPALLGLRDEAALTGRLRELGSAAAHVQTLAVPILASAPARPAAGGLLGRKRDRSDATETVGCEPSLFAEQIQIYLDRAAVERDAHATPAATDHAPTTAMAAAADLEDLLLDEPPALVPDSGAITVVANEDVPLLEGQPIVDEIPAAPDAPEPSVEFASDNLPDMTPVVAAPVVVPAATAPPAPRPRPPAPQTRAMEMELGLVMPATAAPPLWRVTEGIEDFYSAAETFQPLDDPPADPDPPAAPVEGPPAVELAPPPATVDVTQDAGDTQEPPAEADDEGVIELELDDVLAAVVSEAQIVVPDRIELTVDAEYPPELVAAAAEAVPDLAAATAADLGAATVADDAATAVPIAAAPAPIVRPSPRPKKAAPHLDDWAYFDPSQSPFKALVRRLEEIAGQTGAAR